MTPVTSRKLHMLLVQYLFEPRTILFWRTRDTPDRALLFHGPHVVRRLCAGSPTTPCSLSPDSGPLGPLVHLVVEVSPDLDKGLVQGNESEPQIMRATSLTVLLRGQ